ncbi:hypothetical protein ACS0TY_030584 [Phlomoides rotata]
MQSIGVCPDEVTFKLIIRGLIKEKKTCLACGVWDQMMENGFTLDSYLSDTIINATKKSLLRYYKNSDMWLLLRFFWVGCQQTLLCPDVVGHLFVFLSSIGGKKKVYRIWKIRSNSKLNRNADKTYSLPNHRL